MNNGKKILIVLIIFLIAFGFVSAITGVLSGEIDPVQWLIEHKVIIAIVLAYILFRYVWYPRKN